MPTSKTNPEGRVNIPLGTRIEELRDAAKLEGTSHTNLGRVLILDGLSRLKSGEIVFRGPSLETAGKES